MAAVFPASQAIVLGGGLAGVLPGRRRRAEAALEGSATGHRSGSVYWGAGRLWNL